MKWREDWGKNVDIAPIAPPPHPTYNLYDTIALALAEDAGDFGDLTTLATIEDASRRATASFIAKNEGIVAGLWVAQAVLLTVDPAIEVHWETCDGAPVSPGAILGRVVGSAQSLLVAERVALNFIQRMSGIATSTHRMVSRVLEGSGKSTILDTRKTIPCLRVLDKWSVLIGGGKNHRIGLFDMLMIKDNHIAAAGGIRPALKSAMSYLKAHRLQRPIEVEVRTLEEVHELIDVLREDENEARSFVTRVMLDNMTKKNENGRRSNEGTNIDVTLLSRAMSILEEFQKENVVGPRIETEASGNVTLESVQAIAETGVDFISCGALTHSVLALDISFNIHVS